MSYPTNLESDELVSLINCLYLSILGRTADETGMNDYKTRILTGEISFEDLVLILKNSEESNKYKEFSEFKIYQNSVRENLYKLVPENYLSCINILWENLADKSNLKKIQYLNHDFFLRKADLFIVGEIETGGYEIPELILEKIRNKSVSLLDIGGNIGLASIKINSQLQSLNSISIVEPNSENLEITKKNLAFYNKDIQFFKNFIDPKPGESNLYFPNNDPEAYGSIRNYKINDIEIPKEKVQNITFQEICKSHKYMDFNILKIDIEGGERNIFNYSEVTDDLKRFDMIYIEAHDWIEGNQIWFSEIERIFAISQFKQLFTVENQVYNSRNNRDKLFVRF